MNEPFTLLGDLLSVLSDEDLLRIAVRLRRKGLERSALAIELERGVRETAAKRAAL